MRNPLTILCVLLLACFGLAACATPERSRVRPSPEGKNVVAKEVVQPVRAVRRHDNYRGRYFYESDRYARMVRWNDPMTSGPDATSLAHRPIPVSSR